jgi:hypothetical protein
LGGKIAAVIFTDLNEPEHLLWQAFPHGTWVDLRAGDPVADDLGSALGWGPGRVIRAEVVRALLLAASEVEPGYVPGVRLRGARITGRLDLMGASLAYPLVCEYCSFDEELRFVESSTRTVRIASSCLPSLNGTRMRLDGILSLFASTIAGVLRLDQARLSGQLSLRDAVIGAGSGTEAVAASGLAVDGGVDCAGLRARGSVGLEGAGVAGPLDLSGARITRPGQQALILDRAEVGRLDCRGMVVEGEMRMHNSRISASIMFGGARLDNPGGVALSGGGLNAAGGLFLIDGFAAFGEVRLYGANLAANVTISGGMLKNPGGIALNLNRAAIGVFTGPDLTCDGQISLIGARIASDLDLRGAHLAGSKENPALVADRASIDGALIASGLHSHGEISLRTARVGQRALFEHTQLDNPGGTALRLSRAQVSADVFCNEMTCVGRVKIAGATIGGELSFKGARIRNAGGIALDASALDAGELSLRLDEPAQGLVDLRHARIKIFRDDPGCWPAALSIDGLTYETLEPRLPAQQRLQWLARDPDGHQQQPYEQLAAHYAAVGQPADARHVMHESERIQRRAKTPLARTWGLLQDVTIGYGYRPVRAVAWLAILLAAGSIMFAIAPPPPLGSGAAPHFNPVIYALDLLLPVVDLGQKHAFNPDGAEQWFSYVLIAGGWVLVTTIAAGAARVLSRRLPASSGWSTEAYSFPRSTR